MTIEESNSITFDKPFRKLLKNRNRKYLGSFSSCAECVIFSLSKLELKKFKNYCTNKKYRFCILEHKKNHYTLTCERFIYFSYLHSQQQL